jgi:hypothetical protein
MKNKWYVLLLFLPLTACIHHLRVEGNHHVVTESRNVSSFSEVKSQGDFEVNVIRDSIQFVEVEAEENLMPYIETHVSGNDLCVKTKNHRWLDNNFPIRVTVHTPSIDKLDLSGSGSLNADSLNIQSLSIDLSGSGEMDINAHARYLTAKISGSGHMTLSGDADESDIEISGSGRVDGYNMVQDTCFADISGSGHMYIQVIKFLDVKISGSGKIHYLGNPVINTDISGSGEVVHE